MASDFRVCFFFSDTGGGHRSAVNAIQAAVLELISENAHGHTFEVAADTIVEKSHPINKFFVGLYNYLLRNRQDWMRYYFWAIDTFRPNDSELGYQVIKNYLFRVFDEMRPSVIVSVHPMTNQYVARALRERDLHNQIKLLTVVTDPNGNFWRGWACPDSDLTLVPNSLSKQQLVEWGVAPERVRIVGMPVNPEFLRPPVKNRKEFLESVNLDPDRLTLCINAGWAGGGNMLDIYREVAAVNRDLQVLFVCGRNEALIQQASAAAKSHKLKTSVIPYTDCMSDLMASVDMMVTKAGGLTTFECLARKLPIVFDTITPPMPQEMGTVELLVRERLAHAVENPIDIVNIVDRFQPVADRAAFKLPSCYSLDRVNAVYDIAKIILGFCDPSFNPSFDLYAAESLSVSRLESKAHLTAPSPILEI